MILTIITVFIMEVYHEEGDFSRVGLGLGLYQHEDEGASGNYLVVLVREFYLHGTDGASQLFGRSFTVDGSSCGWAKEFQGTTDSNAGATTACRNGGTSYRICQCVQATTVNCAVGIQAGGAHLQHTLCLAITSGSDGNAVMTVKKIGIVNSFKYLGFSVHGSSPCRERGYHLLG